MKCRIFREPPSNFTPTVHVAGCFILFQDKFLILKRHPDRPQGKTWGIPSGKLEKNETPMDAILRELMEEISYKASAKELKELGKLYVEHPDLHFVYHLFFIKKRKIPKTKLYELEHTEQKWVNLEEAKTLPLIGGGLEVIEYILDKINRQQNLDGMFSSR